MDRSGRHHLASSSARRWTLLAVAITLGLTAAAAAGFAAVIAVQPSTFSGVHGTPQPVDFIDPLGHHITVDNVPANDTPPRSRAQEQLVAAVVADLTAFWSQTLPTVADQEFAPLRGSLTAMNSSADSGNAPCVASPAQIIGNAFYCPSNDSIVYDSAALVPVLLHRYGEGGLVATFAHEFGHAVRAQVVAKQPSSSGSEASDDRGSLLTEAQGDCDAGAFVAWVVAGKAPHVHLGPDTLAGAIGPLVDFADPVTVSPNDPHAHGLAVDRLTWFVRGMRGGAASCTDMTARSLSPTLGEVPVPHGGQAALNSSRYSDRAAVVDAATQSIAAFENQPPATIQDRLDTDEGLDAELQAISDYGQFAQATRVVLAANSNSAANQNSAATQNPTASPRETATDTEPNTATDTDAACHAGAWVRSVFGHSPSGTLGSWPGDVDEGLSAVRHGPGGSFNAAVAYIDGFHGGSTTCG